MHTSVASMGITDGITSDINGVGSEKIISGKRGKTVQGNRSMVTKEVSGILNFFRPLATAGREAMARGKGREVRGKEA